MVLYRARVHIFLNRQTKSCPTSLAAALPSLVANNQLQGCRKNRLVPYLSQRQTSNEVQKSSGCCTALYFKEEIINFIKHIHRY